MGLVFNAPQKTIPHNSKYKTITHKPCRVQSSYTLMEAQQLSPQYLRIVSDCTNICNSTTDPDVYFSRYNTMVNYLIELSKMERNIKFTGQKPSTFLRQVRNSREAQINLFVDRIYDKTLSDIKKLMQNSAKINHIDLFLRTIYDIDSEIYPSTRFKISRMVEDLKKQAELTDEQNMTLTYKPTAPIAPAPTVAAGTNVSPAYSMIENGTKSNRNYFIMIGIAVFLIIVAIIGYSSSDKKSDDLTTALFLFVISGAISFYSIKKLKGSQVKTNISIVNQNQSFAEMEYQSENIENVTVDNFNTETLPKSPTTTKDSILSRIDEMSTHGLDFELFTEKMLLCLGYSEAHATQGSGDFGIDVLAKKEGISYAIQCKCYSNTVGNKAVQEAYSGKSYYHCMVAVVLTNNYFTDAAKETAKKNNVLLWDRNTLKGFLDQLSDEQIAELITE